VHDRGKTVGWTGRHIYKKAGDKNRFLFPPEKPADYMFNQHLIRTYTGRKLFVVEGELDAIPMQCLASRASRLTKKQINLLRLSGKDIVMIPDRDSPQSFLEVAQQEKWYVACPKWPMASKTRMIKDIGEAIRHYGLLYTTESIMASITNNMIKAETFYNINRGKNTK
jgi:hypothetical protein